MSTTSLVIDADQSGLNYTVDLNNAFEAINSCHSGSSAPTDEVVAGKFWLDTSGVHPVLKVYRNGWKSLFTLNSTTVDIAINDISANDITLAGDVSFADNGKTIFGAGTDLQIYSDGTNAFIQTGASANLIQTTGTFRVKNASNTEDMISADENGAVSLFYDNSLKLATTASGVDVTGALAATSFSGDGSSLTNVFTTLAESVWTTGTDTTETIVSPAKVKAAVEAHGLKETARDFTGAAGYITFSNGLIFQWDNWNNSHGGRNFPITFPNACLGFSYTQQSGWFENWHGYKTSNSAYYTGNVYVGTNASRATYQAMFSIGY